MQMSSIEQEVRSLIGQVSEQPGRNLYALVDGALHRPAFKEAKAFVRPHAIFPPGGVVARSDLSALPFLVELTAQDNQAGGRLIKHLSDWALHHAAVTWLASDWSASALAEQLALRMDAELPQSMAIVLRFADAHVLPALHDTLKEEQRASFFGCASGWWYVSRGGEFRALPLYQEQGARPLPFEPPLRLSAHQEQQLLDAAEPDAVMQILRRHDAQALNAIAPDQRYDLIKACLGRAKTWSVETPSDLALFCMVAMAHGLAFDEMADWNAALGKLRAGETTMIDVIQQVGPQV